MYDSHAGIFLSPDSVFSLLNQFSYTFGNPIWFSDRDGSHQESVSTLEMSITQASVAIAGLVVFFNPLSAVAWVSFGLAYTSMVIMLTKLGGPHAGGGNGGNGRQMKKLQLSPQIGGASSQGSKPSGANPSSGSGSSSGSNQSSSQSGRASGGSGSGGWPGSIGGSGGSFGGGFGGFGGGGGTCGLLGIEVVPVLLFVFAKRRPSKKLGRSS